MKKRLRLCLILLIIPRSLYASPLYPIHFAGANGQVKASYKVELALSEQAQIKGLMFRKSLAADSGMLFHYPENQPVAMWMRNTLIPLDMIFVNRKLRVFHIHANAVPEDETLIRSPAPAAFVIELNGGEAARIGLKKGDKLILSKEASHALFP